MCCDHAGTEVDVDEDDLLGACFAGLPMGWSWRPYFCHEALTACCRRAMLAVQPSASLLADRSPAPMLSATSGFCAPYVDNGSVVAGSAAAAERLLSALKDEEAKVGLVFHEEVVPTRTLDLLGRTLDLQTRILRPSRRRMWRLWFAQDDVVRKP